MLNLAAAVVAYLIGSIPTAYLIGKYLRGIDISKNGTGNIGAMNAFEVTRSKTIGITVGAIDIAKGTLVTFVAMNLFGLVTGLVASLFVVLGHNYSVYMDFKGGRGLATSAGAFLVLAPLAIGAYLLIYYGLRLLGLKLYLSSVLGILAAAILVVWNFSSSITGIIVSGTLMLVVLSKHLIPLRNELRNV